MRKCILLPFFSNCTRTRAGTLVVCHRPVSSVRVREGTKTGGGGFSSQDGRGKPLFFFFKSSSIRGCSLEKIDKKF